MRESDLPLVVEAVREPIAEFVRESRVRVALLVSSSGQVVAQHGFRGRLQIVNVASLAAAAHAAAGMLARITGRPRWLNTYHAGEERHLLLAPLTVPAGELILVAIFDRDSSIGLAQLFYERLAERIRSLSAFRVARPSADARSFEGDLEAGVRRVLPYDGPESGGRWP